MHRRRAEHVFRQNRRVIRRNRRRTGLDQVRARRRYFKTDAGELRRDVMPTGPAARILDNVAHPLPQILTPGPASMNVLIGFLPAWRGVPAAAAAALQAAKTVSDTAIKVAEGTTMAAAGTPGAPAAK